MLEPLIENDRVAGVRLIDQGTDKHGNPAVGFMPGMDIRAGLTVVGDGPIGSVGRQLDQHFGMPPGHHQRDWAIGMKMTITLPEHCTLEPGTVLHTFGYPEPEIFGFLYVYPGRMASLGIFVPSWLDSPVRTAYRYLQHWMLHPYLWRHLQGGTMRSWGAKSLQESGCRGEPHLAGHGYARIGEGSGSTNVLTGSGVDEAWTTGVHLAEGVIELLEKHKPFTRENLEQAYVQRRRASWVDEENRQAERARDGFNHGLIKGLMGMTLAGFSKGKLALGRPAQPPYQRVPDLGNLLSRQDCTRGTRPNPKRVHYQGRVVAQRLDGALRLAGYSLRWSVTRLSPGCAVDRRQGAGPARLCRSRGLPVSRSLPRVR